MAARYTESRRPNFDVYLSQRLAKYNKEIFGPLCLGGLVYALVAWVRAGAGREVLGG